MVGRQLRRRWRCPRCGDLGARSGGGPGAAGPSSEWRPTPDLDADTARFDRLLDQAIKSGDLDEQNRLETWLWLDGPAQPEGRVGGPGRSLLLDMAKALLFHGVPEQAGASGIDAWSQLDRVNAPATVACGDLDVPFLIGRSRELAEYLPNGRHPVLAGMAHLPQIEAPAAVAALVGDALTRAKPHRHNGIQPGPSTSGLRRAAEADGWSGVAASAVCDRGCVASVAHELLVDRAAGSVVERIYVKCWLG